MSGPVGVLLLSVSQAESSGARRLEARLGGVTATAGGLAVLLDDRAPEEVLAACCLEGIPVQASRVVRLPPR